jgi:hypothetical protein
MNYSLDLCYISALPVRGQTNKNVIKIIVLSGYTQYWSVVNSKKINYKSLAGSFLQPLSVCWKHTWGKWGEGRGGIHTKCTYFKQGEATL